LRAFGIWIAASRLPSLLAVVLLAWLAWRTALAWLDDRVLALLAMVILLAHPETAHLATRVTPDALTGRRAASSTISPAGHLDRERRNSAARLLRRSGVV
jgi:4-amino-4-deoxy-L-arabinose transferase-like glycosyltransferase